MRYLALILLAGCVSCSSSEQSGKTPLASAPPPPAMVLDSATAGPNGAIVAPQPASTGAESATLAQLRGIVADTSCTEPSQCQTVEVGAKACGGAEYYLPWSERQGRGSELFRVATRYHQERKAALAREGAMGDCRVVPDPGATCQGASEGILGKCVLGGHGGAGLP